MKPLVFVAALVPFAHLVWRGFNGGLTADPLVEVTNDTGIWTLEILEQRAASYGLSVDAYKTNNVLKVEVTSQDVAELAAELCGPLFAKTTGAQIPIDGGNDRVI